MASESRRNRSKQVRWRLEWLGQTGVEKLVGLLPGPLAFRVGEKIGELMWLLMPSRRRIVLRNLRIAFYGEYDLPELRLMARESFRRTGANLLSALHSTSLTVEEIDEITTVENPEVALEILSKGAGILMMPPHMGNWELLTRIKLKYPSRNRIGALYRPLNNPLLDERVLRQREMDGSRLFSKRESFHQLTSFLKEGGILGILADQRVGPAGELVQFFGRLTRASPLPRLISRRAKVDALAMATVMEAPGRWRFQYHSVRGQMDTAGCLDAIERAMKSGPLDVFWLQERWKVYFSRGGTIRDWLGPDDLRGEKPHRALVWLAGVPASWEIPPEWIHPDVIYEAVLATGQAPPAWLPAETRIHEVVVSDHRDDLARELATIDAAHGLPVDYILTRHAPKALLKAARMESIPIASLPYVPSARPNPLDTTAE